MSQSLIFFKYHGAGNDFIIIDNRFKPKKINVEIVKKICHRQNIGCDQLILINNSLDNPAEIACEMQIFNSDGSESSNESLPPVYSEDDVKTMREMFPTFDEEIIRSVLETNNGHKENTINILLQMITD